MPQTDSHVEIGVESLEHLVTEAEHTVDGITDPDWEDEALTDAISKTRGIMQNNPHSETVEVATEVLEILLSEAEQTVECIDDPEWHEAAEDDIKPAIKEAQNLLYGGDDV